MDNIYIKTCNDKLVNHPNHYQSKNGMEAIDVIDSFELNFNLGNAVKYILRCGKKDNDVQELKKAIWYIEHEIQLRDTRVVHNLPNTSKLLKE